MGRAAVTHERAVEIARRTLDPVEGMAGVCGGPTFELAGVTVGEWSLRRAAFTDRHQHDEINAVVEGELQVSCNGVTHVVAAGESILVPAGTLARYCAPHYARMHYVYGPGPRGVADVRYEEL
ncbi:MAG: cupin domain-containing protein [Sporichthyaceae bacterium]